MASAHKRVLLRYTDSSVRVVVNNINEAADPDFPMTLWLRRQPPRERLTTMYAIANVFPVVNGVSAWTAAITDTLTELPLTPGEHEDILIAAAELVGRLIGS
jgi:hypothetical protein